MKFCSWCYVNKPCHKQVGRNDTLEDSSTLTYATDQTILGLTFCRNVWWRANGHPCWWKRLVCQRHCFLSFVLRCAVSESEWRSLSVSSSAASHPRSTSQLTVEKQNDVVSSISPSAPEPLKQQWLTRLLQSFYVVTRTVSIFCHFFALAMIMLLPQKCICFKGNNTD